MANDRLLRVRAAREERLRKAATLAEYAPLPRWLWVLLGGLIALGMGLGVIFH